MFRKGVATAIVAGWVLVPFSAAALTGSDVLDKMNADQRGSYLAGSVGMAAFLSHVKGDKDRADCIMSWYYEDNGTSLIVKALDRYKDREVLPIVQALIERKCGR